ncbi:MAG: M23 family metallopeptidase [Deltaproteobacteria bacterium]|nr:M23 family metallopeptidase [Deltaproteobacteria bacterium]
MRARTAAACLAATLAACAHAPAKQTFAEAGLLAAAEPEGPPAPPVKVAAPRAAPAEVPAGPPVDAVLLPFAAEARARRGRVPAGRFPAEAAQAWAGLCDELARYLQRPMPHTPLLELARTRVTVESERAFDERRFGPMPADLAARLDPLLARLDARAEAARAVGARLFAHRAPPALRWPLEGAGLSSGFGMRVHPIDGQRRMHWGIDLAAAPGRVVASAGPGYVVLAGWMSGYGWLVEVRHPGEVTSRYSHLSRILCNPGDEVEAGQVVGLVGDTGRATGPHLHFEVWREGKALDPLALLGTQLALGDGGR